MGRTNPTYRHFLEGYEQDWQEFRRGLRCRHQADFDRMFTKANYFADAAGYQNATNPEIAILLSIILSQEVEIRKLRATIGLDESELPIEMESSDASQTGGGPR